MPRATNLRWATYQYPAKEESEEEVIFLSSSGAEVKEPPRDTDRQGRKFAAKPRRCPKTSSKEDLSSDPEIIEVPAQVNDSEIPEPQAARMIFPRLRREAEAEHRHCNTSSLSRRTFPWRRPSRASALPSRARSGQSTAEKRTALGAVVKCEDESSPPDVVTDTALVDVAPGGLPKRSAGEVSQDLSMNSRPLLSRSQPVPFHTEEAPSSQPAETEIPDVPEVRTPRLEDPSAVSSRSSQVHPSVQPVRPRIEAACMKQMQALDIPQKQTQEPNPRARNFLVSRHVKTPIKITEASANPSAPLEANRPNGEMDAAEAASARGEAPPETKVCEASRERSEMASEKMTSGEDAAEAPLRARSACAPPAETKMPSGAEASAKLSAPEEKMSSGEIDATEALEGNDLLAKLVASASKDSASEATQRQEASTDATDQSAAPQSSRADEAMPALSPVSEEANDLLSKLVASASQSGAEASSASGPVGPSPSEVPVREEVTASRLDTEIADAEAPALEEASSNQSLRLETDLGAEAPALEDHAASSSRSSSSSQTNPALQSLRQRIDACVAAQGPLREKANEMLRSLHHHRATLKAARKEVDRTAQSAEVAALVRQAQLLAELRHSHSQVCEVHAHCIAENLDLKEKLRASLERRENLAKQLEHELSLGETARPIKDCGIVIEPPPGLGGEPHLPGHPASDSETSSGETKTESEPDGVRSVSGDAEDCEDPELLALTKSEGLCDDGGKEVILDAETGEEMAEQPEPEPLKSPQVLPVEAEVPVLQSLPFSAQDEANPPEEPEVPCPPGLETVSTARSLVGRARTDSRESVEGTGRCWVAKSKHAKQMAGADGVEARHLSALKVGMQVGGVILHSCWLGVFVNIGAEIDGFVEASEMPEGMNFNAGDFVTGLVLREIDLEKPRLLLSAANVVVRC
ncbi:unnamed protein product [Durusdinium trenchii]|uniref:S1 motif domain-containing protein n=1 Tax=Durusdinium trenchii TaxID=1381693 RepID=A0ABP0QKS2_9DINO